MRAPDLFRPIVGIVALLTFGMGISVVALNLGPAVAEPIPSGSARQLSRAPQETPPFAEFFENKTMRVDYYHTGGMGEEIISLDQVVSDGPWPGSLTRLRPCRRRLRPLRQQPPHPRQQIPHIERLYHVIVKHPRILFKTPGILQGVFHTQNNHRNRCQLRVCLNALASTCGTCMPR